MLLVPLAHAQDILPLATLEAWRDELRAPIEAAAGRAFLEVPALRIATPQSLAAREQQLHGSGFSARDLRDALAFYDPFTQEVFLQSAVWKRTFRERVLPPSVLGPVVRCVLAHEMVHALQHQYAPTWHLEGDASTLADSLGEGHADHVAAGVCGGGTPWLDQIQGLDLLASHPPTERLAMDYGYAEAFVRHLEAAAGTEAVWAALSAPPPRELVVRVGEADVPPGWRDLAPLVAAALPMGGPFGEVDGGAVSASDALARAAPLPDDRGQNPMVPAAAGLAWRASVGDHHNGVMTFLLESEADGRAWLARRGDAAFFKQVPTLFEGRVSLENAPRTGAAPRLRRLPGVTRTLTVTLDLPGDWAYREVWALQGRRLLGAYTHDARPERRSVEATVAALVALDLPVVGPGLSPADAEALRSRAPAAPLPRTPSWEFVTTRLYPTIQRGDWAACIATAEADLLGLPVASRAGVVATALPCARRADDLGAADRLVAAMGRVDLLPRPVGLEYAILLAEAERWEDALAALAADHPPYSDIGWAEAPGARQGAASIALRASVHLQRWDDVDRALAEGAAPPEDLAWAREQRDGVPRGRGAPRAR